MSNVTVHRGETARFDCKIVAQEPEPSVEWYRHVAVNGSYFDADGAPYLEQLDVLALFTFPLYKQYYEGV